MDSEIVKEISVSDPTRKFSRLHMKISGKIDTTNNDKFNSVFDNEKETSELTIDLPQGFYSGKSITIKL